MSLMYSMKNSKKTAKVENRTNRAKMLNKRCIKLKQDLTLLTQGQSRLKWHHEPKKSVTIHKKAAERYFSAGIFFTLYKIWFLYYYGVSEWNSQLLWLISKWKLQTEQYFPNIMSTKLNKLKKCDYLAERFGGAVNYAVQGGSNYWVSGQNSYCSLLTGKLVLSSTLIQYSLLCWTKRFLISFWKKQLGKCDNSHKSNNYQAGALFYMYYLKKEDFYFASVSNQFTFDIQFACGAFVLDWSMPSMISGRYFLRI